MSRDTGSLNNKQGKTRVNKEVNAGLLKQLPDRALPLTARSPMQVSVPPLISYIQRQFHHLGESSSQLTRWVIGRDGLASTTLRAIRPPLLSRTFDYIRRKANFVPSVWQRTLDLPWYRRDPNWRRYPTQTTGTNADRNLNVNLQPDEISPDILRQISSDIEEGQPGDKADETYPLATTDTYSSINNNLPPSPLMGDGLPITGNISPAAGPITLPLHIKRMPDKNYTIESAQPLPVTVEEPSVRKVDEAYPAIIKNLFSQPVFTQRIIGTNNKLIHPAITTNEPASSAHTPSLPVSTEQIRDGTEARSGTQLISPQAGHSDIPSDVSQSYEIREPDHRQTKDIEDRMTEVNQQTQYTGLGQILSRLLTPITQLMIPQRKPTEAYPQENSESISEVHTSPIRHTYDTKSVETEGEATSLPARQAAFPFIANIPKITALRKPILSIIHRMPALASLKQGAILQRISPLHTSPALSELTISETTLKRPGSFISRLLHQSAPQLDQGWNQKSSVSPSMEREDQKADAIYEAQSMADMSQSTNRLHLDIPEYGSVDQDSVEGHASKLLPYREPPSADIPSIHSLAANEKIHDTMTVQSQQLFKSGAPAPLSDIGKKYRFLRHQEYASSTPDSNYARQLASEMPLTFPIQPKAENGTTYNEELLTDISENINELPYSRNQHVPELSLAPVIGYTPVMASSQIARVELPEPGGIEIDEDVTKPDVDVIAEDVYRILKRRLSVERERKLGVF